MERYKKIVVLVFSFVLITPFLWAQNAASPIDSLKPDIDALVKPVVDGGFSPGMVVGLIYKGQTWVWGYGAISSKNANPPNGDTEFEIASITKLFTNLLFSDMVHRNQMGLEDKVQLYLPRGVKMPVKDGHE